MDKIRIELKSWIIDINRLRRYTVTRKNMNLAVY